MLKPSVMGASDSVAQMANQAEQWPQPPVIQSPEPPAQTERDVYVVSAVGEEWSITLYGQVIGKFVRRSDALLAAIICANASIRIRHDAEVLTRSASGETHSVWTYAYHR
jgi:hypothetical protein